MKQYENRLRNVLKVNMLFSSLSGLGILFSSDILSRFMNINNTVIFFIVGIGLLLFSMLIASVAFAKGVKTRLVQMIIMQDGLWVIGSIVLLILNPFQITPGGNLLITIVAIIVLMLAIKQYRTLKNLKREESNK